MTKPLIIFDMDGVLVDVTGSYRETVAQTVAHFTGRKPGNDEIQQYKNQGGFNDDWKLSHHLVSRHDSAAEYETVKAKFESLFWGDGSNGLMMQEKWVANPGVLESLAERFALAVFTGRPKPDAQLTLKRFAGPLVFDPIVGMYDVQKHKPDPEGLLQIAAANCDCDLYYVGDTVDDARAARAAKVPFIGIAGPSNPAYIDLVFLFQAEKAHAIIDDINYLHEVLP
jgi:HAD superfamily phosphatase